MAARYLHVSKKLLWDPKEKRLVPQKGGVTVRGAVTQTLLKEAVWLAKQRRKKERKAAKRALQKSDP